MSNFIEVDLSQGTTLVSDELWQYDYGQYLKFTGVELPAYFQVHFSNEQFDGKAVTNLGTPTDGVLIPNDLLRVGTIYAWVYLHTGTEDGETEYRITIPVRERSEPITPEPTPQEEDIINQAIASLAEGVERAETAAENAEGYAAEAEGYKTEAESARDEAQGYASEAQSYDANAAISAENAQGYVAEAKAQADAAASYADEAESYMDSAEGYATAADASADRAEQAATSKGYIYMYIDENGHLMADITNNVEVRFYQEDGHLFMEERV